MARLDRVLRTIVLVPVFALGATLVTLLVAWILLHTPIGREEIREFAQGQLQAQLGEGTATIEGADFDLSGQLSLSGIAIELDGRPVVSVETLTVDVELFSFLRGELRVPKIQAVAPYVDATADLARLAPPPEPDDGGGGLTVLVDRVVIENGKLDSPEATVDQIEVDAALDMAARTVTLSAASAHWVERARTVAVSGTVREVDGVWVTKNASVAVAGVSLDVDWGSMNPVTGGVLAAGGVAGSAEDILALGGEWLPPEASQWRGDIDLGFTGIRSDRDAAWELSADGSVGAAQVSARGQVGGANLTGRVRAIGVDPRALYDDELAPEADLDLKATVGEGEATLLARGTIAGVDIPRLDVRAVGTLDAGSVTADLTDARGVIHAEARGERSEDGAIRIDESHLHGDVTDLVAQLARKRMVRMKQLKVDLHAVGPTTDLLVSGKLEASGLREGELQIARVDATVAVPHVSVHEKAPRLAGRLDVTASRFVFGPRQIGYVRARGSFEDNLERLDVGVVARDLGFADLARGDAVIRRDPRSWKVDLGEVWVTTDTLTWDGSGGHVAYFDNGRVEIEQVKLGSPAGKLEVDGVLDAPRARRAEGKLLVKLRGLDLAAAAPTIASVLKVEDPLEGTVEAEVEVARRGAQFETVARADFAGVVWRPGSAAANGFVRGKLGGGRLVAEVEVKPRDDKGLVRFQVEARAPRDSMNPDAWRRLDLADIDRSELSIEQIDSRVVERFAGDVLPFDGAVQGTVTFPHEGKQAFFIDVDVTGVETPWIDSVGANLDVVWDSKALAGRAALTHQGAEVIGGDIGLDRGFQQLWRRPLRDFLTARVRADAEVRQFDLNRLERAGLIDERLTGQLDGDVTLTGTVERPRVELTHGRGSNVKAAGIQVPQLTLGGDWEGKVVNVGVRAQQSAGGSLKVDGGYSWEAEPRVSGTVKATSFDLAALRVLAPYDTHPLAEIGGRLDADVSVSGPVTALDVRGRASAHRATFLLEEGARLIERGDLRLKFEGDKAVVEQLQAYSGEGLVKGTGLVRFEDWEFELEVETKKFPVVISSYVAAVDAEGSFAGRWIDGWWETRAELVDGTIDLVDTGRALQDIGPLEDVVYVERIGGERVDAGDVAADAMPFEVQIVTIEPIRVKSKEVDARINASLTLRYRGYLTWLQGGVEVERGSFTLFERSYQIARGVARFYGPVPIDPELDIELRRTFPSALVSIFVDDRLSDPRITFTTDPPDYDDTQILQIILGQNPDEADEAGVTQQQRAGAAVGSVLAGEVRDTLKVSVIDVIRTHPDGIEFGKYFFDGTVLVGYRTHRTEELTKNANEGTIEWRLRRNVVVEGFYGDNNIGAVDILYIIRF